ncbi:MAG TPA: 50S ribosomal protein L19 [Pseudobdellovibrionaceae bacterium]|nr:50S ribosomal protein L19 [Pseudobdellovibrionaceae bacterium]
MAKSGKKVLKKSTYEPAKETNLIRRLTKKTVSKNIASFSSGDTVNVFVKVKEGEKERTQLYKGVVIKIQGSGAARSFTVRKVSSGIGVERTFPFASPSLEKVEAVNMGKVRRSRLYFLRGLEGKAAKLNTELISKESSSSKNTDSATEKAAE